MTPAWRARPVVTCARCERERHHAGRGLCHSCHVLTGLDGTRDDYPRVVRPGRHTIEDYEFLRGQGVSDEEIAVRLGIRVTSLRNLVRRHSDRSTHSARYPHHVEENARNDTG